MPAKSELRKVYREKRRSLTPDQVEQLNTQLLHCFSTLSFEGISTVHLYFPIPGKVEPDSLLLAAYLREQYPSIRLVLPQMNALNHSLESIWWEADTPLTMNSWGITEPSGGVVIPPTAIDLVLVPLLAYDKQGNRVGYGKGFYDRFLETCRPDVKKCGVSFFGPEDRIDDCGTHDIGLDLCVSSLGVCRFPADR